MLVFNIAQESSGEHYSYNKMGAHSYTRPEERYIHIYTTTKQAIRLH